MFWSPPRSLYAEAVKSVRGYRFRRAISFSCRPLPRVPCVYLFWKAGLPSGLVATRRSSLILIGRPFRSRNKHSSALFFRSFRWKIPWRRREMPPALSVPSLSEWSTPVCSFLISLVRVLSEPPRDVNGTYEVESVCLVFHLIRELRSEGLKISTAIVKLGHT